MSNGPDTRPTPAAGKATGTQGEAVPTLAVPVNRRDNDIVESSDPLYGAIKTLIDTIVQQEIDNIIQAVEPYILDKIATQINVEFLQPELDAVYEEIKSITADSENRVKAQLEKFHAAADESASAIEARFVEQLQTITAEIEARLKESLQTSIQILHRNLAASNRQLEDHKRQLEAGNYRSETLLKRIDTTDVELQKLADALQKNFEELLSQREELRSVRDDLQKSFAAVKPLVTEIYNDELQKFGTSLEQSLYQKVLNRVTTELLEGEREMISDILLEAMNNVEEQLRKDYDSRMRTMEGQLARAQQAIETAHQQEERHPREQISRRLDQIEKALEKLQRDLETKESEAEAAASQILEQRQQTIRQEINELRNELMESVEAMESRLTGGDHGAAPEPRPTEPSGRAGKTSNPHPRRRG